jgi:hypothetical protein
LLRNAKTAIFFLIEQNQKNRGGENGGEKKHIFCDERRQKKWSFFVFFYSPCYEKPKNATKQNQGKNKYKINIK